MIDLYYTPWSSTCRAVQLTAKLLGIDLNLKRLQVSKKEQLTPEFIKVGYELILLFCFKVMLIKDDTQYFI